MAHRFNPPPGWPPPPRGWVPPPGWQPPPEWPAPPPGWPLWVDDATAGPPAGPGGPAGSGLPPRPRHAKSEPAAPGVTVTSTKREKFGIFGAQKRAEALLAENSGLAEENQRLRQQVSALLGMDPYQLAAESGRLRAQIEADAERARHEPAGAQRDRAGARGQHPHRLGSPRSRKPPGDGPASQSG
jgi:hypothetical protein